MSDKCNIQDLHIKIKQLEAELNDADGQIEELERREADLLTDIDQLELELRDLEDAQGDLEDKAIENKKIKTAVQNLYYDKLRQTQDQFERSIRQFFVDTLYRRL